MSSHALSVGDLIVHQFFVQSELRWKVREFGIVARVSSDRVRVFWGCRGEKLYDPKTCSSDVSCGRWHVWLSLKKGDERVVGV